MIMPTFTFSGAGASFPSSPSTREKSLSSSNSINNYIYCNITQTKSVVLGGEETYAYWGHVKPDRNYAVVYIVIDLANIHTAHPWFGGWTIFISQYADQIGRSLEYKTPNGKPTDNEIFAIANNLINNQSYYILVSENTIPGYFQGAVKNQNYFDAGLISDSSKIYGDSIDYVFSPNQSKLTINAGSVNLVRFYTNDLGLQGPQSDNIGWAIPRETTSYTLTYELHFDGNTLGAKVKIPFWRDDPLAGDVAQYYEISFLHLQGQSTYNFYDSSGAYTTITPTYLPTTIKITMKVAPGSTTPFIQELIIQGLSSSGDYTFYDIKNIAWGSNNYYGWWVDLTPPTGPFPAWSANQPYVNLTTLTFHTHPTTLYAAGILSISTTPAQSFQQLVLPEYNSTAGPVFTIAWNYADKTYNQVSFSFKYQNTYMLPVLDYWLDYYSINQTNGNVTFIETQKLYNNGGKNLVLYDEVPTNIIKNYQNVAVKIDIKQLYMGASLTSDNSTIAWYTVNSTLITNANQLFNITISNLNMSRYMYYSLSCSPPPFSNFQQNNIVVSGVNYTFRAINQNLVPDEVNFTFYIYISINGNYPTYFESIAETNFTKLTDITFHYVFQSNTLYNFVIFATNDTNFDLSELQYNPYFSHTYNAFAGPALGEAQFNVEIFNNSDFNNVQVIFYAENGSTFQIVYNMTSSVQTFTASHIYKHSWNKYIMIEIKQNGNTVYKKEIYVSAPYNVIKFDFNNPKNGVQYGLAITTGAVGMAMWAIFSIGVAFFVSKYTEIDFIDIFIMISITLGAAMWAFGVLPIWVLLVVGLLGGLLFFFKHKGGML